MGLLKQVDPRIRAGLSPTAVRLLTGEPEPARPVHEAAQLHVEPAHLEATAQAQLRSRLKGRRKKRTARGRS
jgi:hypothetical protein